MSDPQPLAGGTDTPARRDTFPPIPPSERIKAFIGDLARPFAIYVTSGAAAIATVAIAYKNSDGFSAAAIFIGAVYAGVGALYVGKAWENSQKAKADADVQKSANTTTTT